jgi:hypothetical protein
LEGTVPTPAMRIWPLSPTSAMRVQTLVVPTSIAEIVLLLPIMFSSLVNFGIYFYDNIRFN